MSTKLCQNNRWIAQHMVLLNRESQIALHDSSVYNNTSHECTSRESWKRANSHKGPHLLSIRSPNFLPHFPFSVNNQHSNPVHFWNLYFPTTQASSSTPSTAIDKLLVSGTLVFHPYFTKAESSNPTSRIKSLLYKHQILESHFSNHHFKKTKSSNPSPRNRYHATKIPKRISGIGVRVQGR